MSRKERTDGGNKTELEPLYRQRRAEGPPPQLDRLVLARANQALARDQFADRPPRRWTASRGAWLTGAATASVAALVLAVVVQQMPSWSPPDEVIEPSSAPATEPRQRPRSDNADRAFNADQLVPSTINQRAAEAMEARVREPEIEAESMLDYPSDRNSDPELTAPESGQRAASPAAKINGETMHRSQPGDITPGAGTANPADEISSSRSEIIFRTRALLARGLEEQARAQLNAYLATDPEFSVPEEFASLVGPRDTSTNE